MAVAFQGPGPLAVSSFTARPDAFGNAAMRNAPVSREARVGVRLARMVDVVLGASLCSLGFDVTTRHSDARYHERVLAAVTVVFGAFLLVCSLLPTAAGRGGGRLRRRAAGAHDSLRRHHAFFFDSAWRGHTFLFFSVSCFPLAQRPATGRLRLRVDLLRRRAKHAAHRGGE